MARVQLLVPGRPFSAVCVIEKALLHVFGARKTFFYSFGIREAFFNGFGAKEAFLHNFGAREAFSRSFPPQWCGRGQRSSPLALILSQWPGKGKVTSFVLVHARKMRCQYSSSCHASSQAWLLHVQS